MHMLIATACLSVSASGTSAVPTRGLIARLDASARDSITVVRGQVTRWASTAPGASVVFEGRGRHAPAYVPGSGISRAAVAFDGRDDVLRCLSFKRRSPVWTLAALIAPDDDVRGGGICCGVPTGGHDYDPGFTVDLFRSRGAFDQISVEGAGRIGGQQDQMAGAYPPGGMHLVVVERRPAEIRVRVDGKPEGARSATPATTVMDELRVGARFFDGREREFLRGRIAALLLYDRTLDGPETKAVETAMRVPDRERAAGEDMALRSKQARLKNRMTAPVVVERWPTIEGFAVSPAGRAALSTIGATPVRTDLNEAMVLGTAHLNSLFDADKDGEPFFFSNCRADGTGVMFHSVVIGIPHVVGRALLGSMMAELAAGIPFPPDGLATLERYLRVSFDNPDHLNSYNDPEKENRRFVEFHNMREGLYGLVMLIEGRKSSWARETAALMLKTLDGITDQKGEWSQDLLRNRGMADYCSGVSPMNASRMVDPLLALHRATGDPLALKLAGLYSRATLRIGFEPDGRFAPMDRSSGHVHSITSSLSGITEYALLTNDSEMLKACLRIMEVGVPEYFSSWGWGDEVTPEHPADEPSRGEINQTGDVIRTCLLLGAAGRPEYYDMAERYVRSMLLPTQHREPELRRFLHDVAQPKNDSERGVLMRTVGGYAMQLPNDRMQAGDWPLSTLDITSGAVHAMAECWRHRVTSDGGAARVNLLFDADTPDLLVHSDLPLRGRLAIVARKAAAAAVRVPGWVDTSTLVVRVNRETRDATVKGGYLTITGLRSGDQCEVQFAVPCRVEKERVDGVSYTTTWAGCQLLRIVPRGKVSPLPW